MRVGNIVYRNANRVPEKTAIVFKNKKIAISPRADRVLVRFI
jgi:hypothetical protein